MFRSVSWDALKENIDTTGTRYYYSYQEVGAEQIPTYEVYIGSFEYRFRARCVGDDATEFEITYKAAGTEVDNGDEALLRSEPAISINGALMVEKQTKSGKLGFNQWTLCSINFCRKTTWYQNFDQQTNIVCEANESYTVYDSGITNWININDLTLAIQDYNRGGPNYGLSGVFQRDGTLAQREDYYPVIKKNDVVLTSGYTIDYANGKVTFAEALTSQDIIKATFRSVKTTGGSEFIIRPTAGHKFVIPHMELNLSTDVKLPYGVAFEVWAGDPTYSFQGEPYYLQYLMKYKSWHQLVGIGVVGKDEYGVFGGSDLVVASEETGWCPSQKSGLQHSLITIPYDFGLEWGKAIELDSRTYTQLRIRILSEDPFPGEYATCGSYVEDVLI